MIEKQDRLLVAHEAPISLFEHSKKFNDYSYALIHLYLENERYRKFFDQEVKDGRMVYLDNSCFEKKEPFPTDKIIEVCESLKPEIVIAPDVLGDGFTTTEYFKSFKKKLETASFKPKIMAIAQGKGEEEFFKCYELFSKDPEVELIGIPYHIKFYHNYLKNVNSDTLKFVMARRTLINRLLKSGYLNPQKKHHLLGCSDPVEFQSYINQNKYNFLYSVDTSCPVMMAMKGKELGLGGLGGEKIKDLLADNIDFEFPSNKEYFDLLQKNVEAFKYFVSQVSFGYNDTKIDPNFKFADIDGVVLETKEEKPLKEDGEIREWSNGKHIRIKGKWIPYTKYLREQGQETC